MPSARVYVNSQSANSKWQQFSSDGNRWQEFTFDNGKWNQQQQYGNDRRGRAPAHPAAFTHWAPDSPRSNSSSRKGYHDGRNDSRNKWQATDNYNESLRSTYNSRSESLHNRMHSNSNASYRSDSPDRRLGKAASYSQQTYNSGNNTGEVLCGSSNQHAPFDSSVTFNYDGSDAAQGMSFFYEEDMRSSSPHGSDNKSDCDSGNRSDTSAWGSVSSGHSSDSASRPRASSCATNSFVASTAPDTGISDSSAYSRKDAPRINRRYQTPQSSDAEADGPEKGTTDRIRAHALGAPHGSAGMKQSEMIFTATANIMVDSAPLVNSEPSESGPDNSIVYAAAQKGATVKNDSTSVGTQESVAQVVRHQSSGASNNISSKSPFYATRCATNYEKPAALKYVYTKSS